MNRLRQFFARISPRKPAGTDPMGNKYFEEPGVHYGRSRRTVTMHEVQSAESMNPQLYDSSTIPAQWRSWLAHTRLDAPTIEEVEADIQRQQIVRERARQLEEQWQKRKLELLETEEYRLLQLHVQKENNTGKMQHVAETETEAETTKQEAAPDEPVQQLPETAFKTGSGETFHPGQWTPLKK